VKQHEQLATPTRDLDWFLVEEGFTLAREHEVESLFAIGNGYVGSRASLAERCALSSPATFVAGAFGLEETGSSLGLRQVADWTHLSATIDGNSLQLDRGVCLEHRRILDLRQGILWRHWRHQDECGRVTRLEELRLASLADRHLLVQSVTLTAENYSGSVGLDATPTGALLQLAKGGLTIAMGLCIRLVRPLAGTFDSSELPSCQLHVKQGETIRLDRVAAVYRSSDAEDPIGAARTHAQRAIDDIGATIAVHKEAWVARWHASDVRIEGDTDAQRVLRFAIYHLTSAANPEDDRVSIGARGLSGLAYKGHVFWDTDIFMLPFYTLTYPEAARALVMYRYHTLPGARAKAARFGYRGALYAWESADNGDEVTPPYVVAPDGEVIRILTGDQEQHISADVAFAVWNYWQATDDEAFLVSAGAEILIETARFWASRAIRGDDRRYHIRGVIGPDEYHEAVDDDAYTNGLAQWNLEVAEEITRLLEERCPAEWRRLSRRLALEREETQRWLRVAADLYTGFDEHTGLFEQFQGYFGLEEIELSAFQARTAPIDVLLGRERVSRSKIIKQPDVVMMIHLFWDRFPPEVRTVNFDYYEPRCAHGSSLSPAIHALVAARLGRIALAERYLRQAAQIDLANNMGNSAGGIHAATMGGLWQAAVFGCADLHLGQRGPATRQCLPPGWRSLSTRIRWRGQWHDLSVRHALGNSRNERAIP
jgi:trehalose/maltose hydrolase-like predicted phosphorylase